MRYSCDECGQVLTVIRWVASWDGVTFVRSYRCQGHVRLAKVRPAREVAAEIGAEPGEIIP